MFIPGLIFSQLESLLKDERERGTALSDRLQIAEVEISERLETIEALKTEMAKHKDVSEKSKCKVCPWSSLLKCQHK